MADYFFGLTDTGRQRDNNEDAFIAEQVLHDRFLAACVIDGVGGYEGGEVAAAIARESILQYFTVPSGSIPSMIQEAVVSANEKIYAEKQRTGANTQMACVLTLALVNPEANVFYYAHVGDTRLYLFRDGSLVKVTKDQSFVGFLEDSGRLTEAEAMAHPKRNEINKALGFESPLPAPSDYIERGESPFLPGDLLLLCSDGLSDLVNRAAITEILSRKAPLAQKGKALISAANAAGGKDNITVVLVQNTSRPARPKATRTPIQVKKNVAPPAAPTVIAAQRPRNTAVPEAALPEPRRRSALVPLLILFSLACLGAAIWQWQAARTTKVPPGIVQNVVPHWSGILLQDTLASLNNDTLRLTRSRFGDTLFVADTLVINGDRLAIRGEGNVVMSDSSRGDAPFFIRLGPGISKTLIDSLEFRNCIFLVTPDNRTALQFRSTKFIASSVRLVQDLTVPDTLFSGTLKGLAAPVPAPKQTNN